MTGVQAINPEVPSDRRIAFHWLAIFCVALFLYGLTANRGVQWQDSGWAIVRMLEGQTVSPLGLALSHPLHQWLGRAVIALLGGWIEPAFAATLLSGVCGAVAVANVLGCVQYATGERSAAWFAAGTLAVAHTFWQIATLTESYTLGAALFSAEIWGLIVFMRDGKRFALVGAFLLNGLGISNHMLAALSTPILAIVLLAALFKRRTSFAVGCACIGAWIAGSGLYLGLVIAEIAENGHPKAVLFSALFGQGYAKNVLNLSLTAGSLLRIVAFILMGFPNLGLVFAGVGVVRGTKPLPLNRMRNALLAMLGVHLLFVLRYSVRDQHTFLLPSYVLIAVFAGFGFAWLLQTRERNTRILQIAAIVMLSITPVIYAFTPTLAKRFNVLGGLERKKPYRDDYVYVFTPWSVVEESADRMGRHAVSLAGSGSDGVVIAEERMAEFAVRYWVIRSGVAISIVRDATDPAVDRAVRHGNRVVLVPANRDEPKIPSPHGTWRREGDLYVLQP